MSDVVSSVPAGSRARRLIPRLLAILCLTVLYYGSAQIGLSLSLPNASRITPVWPPAAISWAAVYLGGYWLAPGVWLGDLAMALPNLLPGTHDLGRALLLGVVKSAISAGTTVGGVFLLRRSIPRLGLIEQVQSVIRFLMIVTISSIVTPLLGLIWFCAMGLVPWNIAPDIGLTWWVGDAISIVLLMPMLVTWYRMRWRQMRVTARWWQGCLLVVSMVVVGQIAFIHGYSVEYLLIPLLLWAAFRFGPVLATGSIVLVAGMALWGTAHGLSSFIRPSLNESLLLLQTFMGAVAITTLMLNAALTENTRSRQELAQANANLERRVQERTSALAEANDSLIQEIQERTMIERALRTSEVEKSQLIESLEEKTTVLEATLGDLKKTQAQLIQTEKMSSLGQLVAGIAHEINNPVSFIYGNLTYANGYMQDLLTVLSQYQAQCANPTASLQELLEEIDLDFIQQDFPAVLASMKTGADRIRQLVLTLRNFTRLDEAYLKWVNLHDGLESTLLILNHRLQSQKLQQPIRILKQYGDLPSVECYADELNQVFMNILNNAIDALTEEHGTEDRSTAVSANKDAMKADPVIEITTQALEPDPSGIAYVAVAIWNNGPQISEAVKDRIFDPFFTTKPIGQGSGLGLSISHYIVQEKHNGKLLLSRDRRDGTEFRIYIPQSQTQIVTAIETPPSILSNQNAR